MMISFLYQMFCGTLGFFWNHQMLSGEIQIYNPPLSSFYSYYQVSPEYPR